MSFVVDNSVVVGWCLQDEQTPYTQGVLNRLRQDRAITSVIWPIEIANVLVVAERRRRSSAAQTAQIVRLLGGLPIQVDPGGLNLWSTVIIPLARNHGLTAYDASYLEVALRMGLPLATHDRALISAASALGVPLV